MPASVTLLGIEGLPEFKAGDDVTTRLLEAATSKNAPEMTEIKPDPSKHQMPSKKKGKNSQR